MYTGGNDSPRGSRRISLHRRRAVLAVLGPAAGGGLALVVGRVRRVRTDLALPGLLNAPLRRCRRLGLLLAPAGLRGLLAYALLALLEQQPLLSLLDLGSMACGRQGESRLLLLLFGFLGLSRTGAPDVQMTLLVASVHLVVVFVIENCADTAQCLVALAALVHEAGRGDLRQALAREYAGDIHSACRVWIFWLRH